jgi:hypothetical protein
MESSEKQRIRVPVDHGRDSWGAPNTGVPLPFPEFQMNFEKLKIIFLDIDGVLNSFKTLVITGHYPHARDKDPAGKYIDKAGSIDKYAVSLVNLLCIATDAYIVLSSSWRIGYLLHEVQEMLAEMGLDPKRVIGMTDRLGKMRGQEIERFLLGITGTRNDRGIMITHGLIEDHFLVPEKITIESYVIIDDDSDMLESQDKNFVNTSHYEGLTLMDTLKAGKVLSNDETFYLNKLQGKPSTGAPGYNARWN